MIVPQGFFAARRLAAAASMIAAALAPTAFNEPVGRGWTPIFGGISIGNGEGGGGNSEGAR